MFSTEQTDVKEVNSSINLCCNRVCLVTNYTLTQTHTEALHPHVTSAKLVNGSTPDREYVCDVIPIAGIQVLLLICACVFPCSIMTVVCVCVCVCVSREEVI